MPDLYGCHNREPFATQMWVQDGWVKVWDGRPRVAGPTGREPLMRWVQVRTDAPDCPYSSTELGRADARCDGCKWKAITADNVTKENHARQAIPEPAAKPDEPKA